MVRLIPPVFVLILCLLGPDPARAQVPLDGYFVAARACPATPAIRRDDNPGEIWTTPGAAYGIIGINRVGGDHYQIYIPDAPAPTGRWVHVDCGAHVVQAGNPAPPPSPTPVPIGESEDNLLALSWQPSFCETKPATTECQALNGGARPEAARRLSLHGLWPQPRDRAYCGVPRERRTLDQNGDWRALPEIPLSAITRTRLDRAMPGTASDLDRHEWTKHGSCHRDPDGAEGYFRDALALTDLVNGSAVGTFLAARKGRMIETRTLRARFDGAFGPGTGERVTVSCVTVKDRTLIVEIHLALRGRIDAKPDLGTLLAAAPPQPPGCEGGILDQAGLD